MGLGQWEVGEVREVVKVLAVEEVAGQSFDAVTFQRLAGLGRRESRDADHSAPGARRVTRPLGEPRQRGPHLAGGAQHENVALERGHGLNVRVGRAGEEFLQLRFGAGRFSTCRRFHARILPAPGVRR